MTLGMIKYHLLVLLREPANLIFGLGLPFLNLFIIAGQADGNANMINYFLPIAIVITALVLCFMDSALSHAYARQVKFLRRVKMTPVKSKNYIITGIISRLSVLLLFTATLITVSNLFFDVSLDGKNWLLIGSMLILVFAMFYFIAMFIANALKGAKNSQNLLYIVFFTMIFLINLPTDTLPGIIQTIALNSPLVFAGNLLSAAWLGNNLFYGPYFITTILLTIIFGFLSLKFFKHE